MGKYKKLVLFDIDYTIFNTDHYREKLYVNLERLLGLSVDTFKHIAREAELKTKEKKGYFHPDTYLEILRTYTTVPVTSEVLAQCFWDDTLYRDSLEENVVNVLKELKRRNFKIGILSTGTENHQLKKVNTLVHVVDKEHVHIFNNKITELKNVLDKYPDYTIFLVDDLPTVLYAAKLLSPNVVTIWRERKKIYEQTDMVEGFVPDYTISHIDQLLTFLS